MEGNPPAILVVLGGNVAVSENAKRLIEKSRGIGLIAWVMDLRFGEDTFCPDCDGNGTQWVAVADPSDVSRAPTSGYISVSGHTGWLKYSAHKFPCPCSDATIVRADGLNADEAQYSVSYYKSLSGKEGLFTLGKRLINSLPETSGFHALYGGYGVGKSGFLKAVVASGGRAGMRALYISATDYLSQIKRTFDDGEPLKEGQVVKMYTEIPVLSLDELGRQTNSEWADGEIFKLLDARYRNRGQVLTLVATNLPPGSSKYGWLESRLLDGEQIIVGGADLRGAR